MTQNEKPVILVVVTSFLALILVYVVYARVQSNKHDRIDNATTTIQEKLQPTPQSEEDKNETSGSLDHSPILSLQELSPLEQKIRAMQDKEIKPWYASISMADMLGLEQQFAFVDGTGIYYTYLGTGSALIDLNATVRRLGGNILEITTKNSIIENLLRGDRILFVNIPGTTFVQNGTKQQKLLVAMIVQIGDDKWFIQAPIDKYYAHKADMKSYFETLYDKVL